MPGQRSCLPHHNRSRSYQMHCREWLHMGSIRSERNLSPHTTLPESEGNSHSDTSRWKDYQCQGLPHRWSKHIRYMYRIPHDRIRAILRKSRLEQHHRRSLRTPTIRFLCPWHVCVCPSIPDPGFHLRRCHQTVYDHCLKDGKASWSFHWSF